MVISVEVLKVGTMAADWAAAIAHKAFSGLLRNPKSYKLQATAF